MSKQTRILATVVATIMMVGAAFGAETEVTVSLSDLVTVQKYYRAIHIMAMLLVGFGFLMVFVRKYGRSALTATYLLVSVAIPLYFLKDARGIMGHSGCDIDRLILAEFAAAGLLICAGAVLGRLKLIQYIVLGLLFVPCYAMNEWILLDAGLSMIPKGAFVDTGGSIVIHTFGALFGTAAMLSLTSRKAFETEIEADATSERFSLLGSMVLWVFWPSFCAALVAPEMLQQTIVNVILALCGSTVATYVASLILRKKVSVADIANAALAGGVAIGSTCDKTNASGAFVIGILAGVLSTFGFAVIQERLQKVLKKVDTCGVLYLHGLPGLLGGFAALFVVSGIDAGVQVKGIGITVALAALTGLVVGKLVSFVGTLPVPYQDDAELDVE
ncbi:MAG: ammonium transporter [Verrucomicrobia bacterium]|jgi:ammonium transporter Rh|nr:ammonium transporter [Verrucomicrobiota bacterium]